MPSKRSITRYIDVPSRAQIVAKIPFGPEHRGGGNQLIRLLLLGDGGVASHELGAVVGVCAEAPLPRVTVTEKILALDGICGIASTLQYWGAIPVVACPEGDRQTSLLQRSLLTQEAIVSWPLCSRKSQTVKYTQRVFAGGHQFIHLETNEVVAPSLAGEIKRNWGKIHDGLDSSQLLGLIDNGNTGMDALVLSSLVRRAKRAQIPVFYEPRTARLFPLASLDVVKVNDNQMRHWFGSKIESDRDAMDVAKKLMIKVGTKNLIYTRGERGILLCQQMETGQESFLIEPEKKKLFDLVSVGDVVSAALIFCVASGLSLLEAVCFAATAAEYGLDRRYSKRLDLSSIHKRSPIEII